MIEGPVLPTLEDTPAPSRLTALEVREELCRVLCGCSFSRARRARLLLEHLLDRYQAHAERDLREYAIGLAVFQRDASTYNTLDDPIVRVQVGRLRQKLAEYYLGEGRDNPVRISVPLRGYVPVVEYAVATPARHISFVPLACLGDDARLEAFSQGVNEELFFRLHRLLGDDLVEAPDGMSRPRPGAEPHAWLRLEGSLRADGQILRASLRLREPALDSLVWCGQVDNPPTLSIAHQASVANSCCRAIGAFLRQP
jgi:TolB-like protein